MQKNTLTIIAIASILFCSCVSKKVYKAELVKYQDLNRSFVQAQTSLKGCEDEKAGLAAANGKLQSEVSNLNKQISYLNENNTQALKQLENLSVISSQQAASIKQSLDNIGAKDIYIQDLQSTLAKKDSLNMALVLNLKGAIGNLDDEDINIKVEKGVVYIDISDKLLFKSGSYEVTAKARSVLSKVSQVLKNQPEIEFMVEGHTDNIPFKKGILEDNWDLSVKRATAVVRILQNEYGLPPTHIAAAGRGEYQPLTGNSSNEGRAANRRTRIIVLPQLDQFFKLLEPKKG